MATTAVTQYTTVLPLSAGLPGWVSDNMDKQRLASYDVYDDMYHNNPETFTLMLRGVDDQPILVPTAKSVIKTMSRYVGRGFGFTVPKTVGTPEQQVGAIKAYGDFFKREEVLSKFAIGRKELLRRGDLFWYLQGDTDKPLGSRISLTTLDPRTVFWLTDDNDTNKILGVQVVEHTMVGDKVSVKRQRWLKATHPEHPAFGAAPGATPPPIAYDSIVLEAEGWDGDNPKVVQNIAPIALLAPEITQLPIYHMKNDAETGNLYGSSELRGLERVIAAINQGATDQDIALAMAGLGMYKSSSGGPVADDGVTESDWIIGPGRVVEDESFERVDGVKSVSPSMDHLKYLSSEIDSVAGITDVTRGQVQAQVAESGVALAIRMSPTIDMADEKDVHIKDVFDHILYDLKSWFKAFEGQDFSAVEVVTAFGDKMPRNRDAELKELLELLTAGVVSKQFVQSLLQERFGYDLPEDIMTQISADLSAANAAADPYAQSLGANGAGAQQDATIDPTGQLGGGNIG